MTSAAVRVAAQLLSKLLVEEVKFLYGVHDKVEELQVELSWMQVFLYDADKKKNQDELVRIWVSQIQELAYEAEDIVENYIHKVSRRGRDKFWRTLPRKLSCTMYNAFPLHEVGSDIDKLTQKISKLNKRLKSYGVQIGNVDTSIYITRIRDMRRTYCDTDDKDLIRREEDVMTLVAQLLNEKTTSSKVVGIVGMGGLGKTTLAREVCRDKAIVGGFAHIVWIYVSPQPQRMSILEETLSQLGQEGHLLSRKTEGELAQKVRSELKRDCLVVLDDIWNLDIWFLEKVFIGSKAKILLTTRLDEVRRLSREAFVWRPEPLSDAESWMLLCKKAVMTEDLSSVLPKKDDLSSVLPKKEDLSSDDLKLLKSLGEKMLKHCKGLPIYIAALGGILATKPKKAEVWEEVLNNITSYLASHTGHDDDNQMGVGVQELSYNELPLYLKPCFLYLGNFPERSEIPTSTLYQLWEAEGLIQSPDERTEVQVNMKGVFDNAEQYLEELVKRCMVEVSELHENGAIKTCRMHDIVRDLCLKKSVEERFLEVVTTDDPKISSSSRQVWRTHRVAIRVRDTDSAETFFNSRQENRVQLRSLLIDLPQDYDQVRTLKFGTWFSKMAKAFELLRVLRLECGKIKKLPDEIESCIHLRYLSFKLAHESELPEVLWKLNYLQTLDLQHNDERLTIPNKLWKLKRLAHLCLPEDYIAKEKLRFSQPRQVRTLVNIDLKDLNGEDMKNMINLRMLSFKKTGSVDSESLSLVFTSNIITSRLVESPISTLSIRAETINQNPQILSSSTDARIEILVIDGILKANLRNIAFPPTLVSLELHGSQVHGDLITGIVIHGLKELHLKQNAIRGKTFVVSAQSFPMLQKLTLELAGNSDLSKVEGTLPRRCLFSIRCPRSIVIQISIALQQLQHNRDLIRIDITD